jgi:hypothetical protein
MQNECVQLCIEKLNYPSICSFNDNLNSLSNFQIVLLPN